MKVKKIVSNKRSYKKRYSKKKVIHKPLPNGRVYMKLHNTFDAITTASAGAPPVADYWVLFSLLNPDNGIIDINGNIAPPTTNWAAYATLYQSYKVHGISIKWVPYYNSISTVNTSFYKPMYQCTDYMIPYNTVLTLSDMLGYNNLRIHNALRPIKQYTRTPVYTLNPAADGSSKLPIIQKGWYDTDMNSSIPPAFGYTIFRTQLETPIVGTVITIGKFLVTYYVEFKGPRHIS